MTAQKFVLEATQIVEEKKAQGIVLLDIHEVSVVSDFFLICSGESFTHMRSIARGLEDKLSEKGISLLNAGQRLNEQWILLDFGNLIVHIFSPEARRYYQLERLWVDAKREDISDSS